jgi:release factor glutamine methyltransferase
MGVKEFWSHELAVSPATLVPRPETELLVDLALREIPRKAEWDVLDLGTGSGAIAVAIASERPMCRITAVDVSAAALNVARENVRKLSLGNVDLAHGNWTAPVRGQTFNVIVSNPPYVRSNDTALLKLQHEPQSALAAGIDGLDAIRVLAADCGELLADDGVLLVEHVTVARQGGK